MCILPFYMTRSDPVPVLCVLRGSWAWRVKMSNETFRMSLYKLQTEQVIRDFQAKFPSFTVYCICQICDRTAN